MKKLRGMHRNCKSDEHVEVEKMKVVIAKRTMKNAYGQTLFVKGNKYKVSGKFQNDRGFYIMNELHTETPVKDFDFEKSFAAEFPNTMEFDEQTFKLAIIVENFVYYVDETESDENANTMIFRRGNFELVSNNYFATADLMETLEKIHSGKLQPEFISDNMKENIELLAESGYFEE